MADLERIKDIMSRFAGHVLAEKDRGENFGEVVAALLSVFAGLIDRVEEPRRTTVLRAAIDDLRSKLN